MSIIFLTCLLSFLNKGIISVEWIARGSKYYAFSSARANGQRTAQTECRALDAHLLSINSRDELDFVTRRISGRRWIGLNTSQSCNFCKNITNKECTDCRDRWQWMNGDSLVFQNWWKDGQPNDNASCGSISTDGKLYDTDCGESYRYICERQESECIFGTCLGEKDPYQYHCQCRPGFSGQHCEIGLIIAIIAVSCLSLFLGLIFIAYVMTNKLGARNECSMPAVPNESGIENNYVPSPEDSKGPCNVYENKPESQMSDQRLGASSAQRPVIITQDSEKDQYEMDEIYEN